MPASLYTTLGIDADATAEEVRRAYKKQALRTHPDRSTENKETAEEEFRKVNAAYEVLSDEQKRKAYDLHGVWPIPEEPTFDDGPSFGPSFAPRSDFFDYSRDRTRPHAHHSHRHPSFDDMFDRQFFDSHFRDPFEIFHSVFGDMPGFPSHPRVSPFMGPDPFQSFFGPPMRSQFPRSMSDNRGGLFSSSSTFISSSGSMSSGPGQWVSESTHVKTINGVTETVHRRRDHQGNEHVTHTYPDGRTKYTINGLEQGGPTPLLEDNDRRGWNYPSSSRYHRSPDPDPLMMPPAPSYSSPPPVIPNSPYPPHQPSYGASSRMRSPPYDARPSQAYAPPPPPPRPEQPPYGYNDYGQPSSSYYGSQPRESWNDRGSTHHSTTSDNGEQRKQNRFGSWFRGAH